jgi:hypothetical protein
VTYIRLADRKTRSVLQVADAQGSLTFELDGSDYEVGIGAEPVLALSGYEVIDAAWASAGSPVKVRLLFCNKGAARLTTTLLKWTTPTTGVRFTEPGGRIPGLSPGESAWVPLSFTAATALAGSVKIQAAGLEIEIPVYPLAAAAEKFRIQDEGDRDGNASPGEAFSLSLPDGRAELITNDPCVDTSVRIVEEGTRYTQAMIRAGCEPGRRVRMLARTSTSYAAIEFPIWYKLP